MTQIESCCLKSGTAKVYCCRTTFESGTANAVYHSYRRLRQCYATGAYNRVDPTREVQVDFSEIELTTRTRRSIRKFAARVVLVIMAMSVQAAAMEIMSAAVVCCAQTDRPLPNELAAVTERCLEIKQRWQDTLSC